MSTILVATDPYSLAQNEGNKIIVYLLQIIEMEWTGAVLRANCPCIQRVEQPVHPSGSMHWLSISLNVSDHDHMMKTV